MRSPHLRLVRSESEIRLVGLASLTHLSLSLLSLDSLLSLTLSLDLLPIPTNGNKDTHTTHTLTHIHTVCVYVFHLRLFLSPLHSLHLSLSHTLDLLRRTCPSPLSSPPHPRFRAPIHLRKRKDFCFVKILLWVYLSSH
jgi:hypothetical protein